MTVKHHPMCSADYPEKPKGEAAQRISRDVNEDGFFVDTCVECGAFETNLPDENDPYWDEAKRELAAMTRRRT